MAWDSGDHVMSPNRLLFWEDNCSAGDFVSWGSFTSWCCSKERDFRGREQLFWHRVSEVSTTHPSLLSLVFSLWADTLGQLMIVQKRRDREQESGSEGGAEQVFCFDCFTASTQASHHCATDDKMASCYWQQQQHTSHICNFLSKSTIFERTGFWLLNQVITARLMIRWQQNQNFLFSNEPILAELKYIQNDCSTKSPLQVSLHDWWQDGNTLHNSHICSFPK